MAIVDGKQLAEVARTKTARTDYFKSQCKECRNSKHCLEWTKVAQNCLGCKLFQDSKAGSGLYLCACLNTPTVKEIEEKKCKHYEEAEV